MHRRTLLRAGAAGLFAARLAEPRVTMAEPLRFPPDFVWGVSTSSCQIEGRGDRKADSIWDTFARIPGTIADHTTPEVTCDSYHRYADDVALLKGLQVKAYRYSISWPRVLPDGSGQPDPRGLDYYERVTDALLKAGIEPWVCLFHWDLPQALQDRGGWGNRAIAGWFTDYAQLMARRLGDRVRRWVMFNEPQVHAIMGHGTGEHAPGLHGREPMAAAGHHQNLAQGQALQTLRAMNGRFELGTVMSLQPVRPAQNLASNREAAAIWDAAWNGAYLDPLFRGTYPARYLPLVEKLVQPGDMAQIRQKIDFLGVNYYSPMYQRVDPAGLLGTNWGTLPDGMRTTAMTWGIDPTGLTDILGELRTQYGNPRVYITENGAFFQEPPPNPSGRIDDQERIAYLRDHFAAAYHAIAMGSNLAGYFIWTLVDNWEWAHGFTATFGLAHLDRATLTRSPKASYDWFNRVIVANSL